MVSSPAGCLSLAITLCILLGEGLGRPHLESPLAAASSRPSRTKRCSCDSWLDKECIYFCHLDIIWVNTPGQTAPYGLGSPPRRRKRSLNRCECSHSKDSICAMFCQAKHWYLGDLKLPPRRGIAVKNPYSNDMKHPQTDLLRAPRDLAVSNAQLPAR